MPRLRLAACALALTAGGVALAAPAHAQSLFVVNNSGRTDGVGNILEYSPTNGTLDPATGTVFTATTSTNVLSSPTALAFDAAGDLFVANEFGDISEFVFVGGALSNVLQPFATGLPYPNALAFDPAGDLFAATFNGGSSNLGTITEFKKSGGVLSAAGQTFADGSGTTGLSYPNALAFDATGDLFVSSSNGGTSPGSIIEFKASRNTLSRVGQVFAGGLGFPTSLAFDAAGDLFAGINGTFNRADGGITEFVNAGGALNPTGQIFATPSTANRLRNPSALAFDAAGDLFAGNFTGTTNYNGSITEFVASGGALDPTGRVFTTATNGLTHPTGLAFSPQTAAVPEAPCGALLALGLLPLGLAARRRRAA